MKVDILQEAVMKRKKKSGAVKMIAAIVVVVILLCGIFAIIRNLFSPGSADNKAGIQEKQQKHQLKKRIIVYR